jgi:hypothetical protein
MIYNLARRIDRIEKKVGGDTIEIRTLNGLIALANKAKKGIEVGEVTLSPEMEKAVEKLLRKIGYEQEHRETA